MRKILFFQFLCLLSVARLYAQSFEYTFSEAGNNHLGIQSIELTSGHFVLAGFKQYPSGGVNYMTAKLYEIDPNGNLIFEKEIANETLSIRDFRILQADTGFVMLQLLENLSTEHTYLSFVKLDNDFNIKYQKVYDRAILRKGGLSVRKEDNGNILITGYRVPIGSPNANTFAILMQQNGDIISENFQIPNGMASLDIVARPDTAGYILYSYRFFFLDSLLNYKYKKETLAYFNYPSLSIFRGPATFALLNDSTYLIGSRFSHTSNTSAVLPQYTEELGIYTTDLQLNVRKKINFAAAPNSSSKVMQAHHNSTLFKYQDILYWGGTSNVTNYPISPDTTNFILARFNNNLQKKWEKRYGGDAYYMMFGLFATADSGCIMVGYRYDFNSDNRRDLYVLKVDGQGEVLTSTIIPTEGSTEVAFNIFPNPFQDGFHLSTSHSGRLSVRLFDASGRLVVQKQFEREIYLQENIPSGVYFYHIQDENGQLLKTGKVVKQ